jgi:hypothetical protein
MYAISVSAFVAADAVASKSVVRITTPVEQLAAGDAVHFTVTPIDGADVIILDSANLAYFATLTHTPTNTEVSCRVAFDTSSGRQEGSCEIPGFVCDLDPGSDECLPPVGEFVIKVEDAEGTGVGATQSLAIENCPDTYYYHDRNCAPCPEHVECSAGSLISDWRLDEGFWRSGDASEDIRKCRFGPLSCPGNIPNERDPYCAPGFVGAVCSECDSRNVDERFYMAWTSGNCESCNDGMGHAPTIGIALGLGTVALLVAALAFTKRNRIKSSRAYQRIIRIYRVGKVKLSIILFAFQVRLLLRCCG